MKALVVDVETTTFNKGAWTDSRNYLVMIACYDGERRWVFNTTEEHLKAFDKLLDDYDLLIGFNFKFDLHWLLNYKLTKVLEKKIHDVQIMEYLLSRQTNVYPSLNDCAKKHLNKEKIDVIQLEYWDNGIQTDDIPWEILSNYAITDVELTYELWELRGAKLTGKLETLFSLECQDLLVLLEMERNGLRYNREGSLNLALEQDKKIAEIQNKFNLKHNVPCFNWSSNEHLSALLYGGTIVETYKVPDGTFKGGQRAGQVKFKKALKEYKLPRMYKPLPKTEMKKEGIFSVEEDVLLSLKGGDPELVTGILAMKKYQKDNNTYLRGLPAKQDEGFYDHGWIFGTFNKCATGTGRVASAKPNLQNLSDTALIFFESRYATG